MQDMASGSNAIDTNNAEFLPDERFAPSSLDAVLRAQFAQRIFNLRMYPWRFHDLLLARYLAAMPVEAIAPIIVTGDSTLAQNNLAPIDTVAGYLKRALARRNAGAGTCPILNIAIDGTAEAYLLVSIRAALALNPQTIYAGITIRDFTQVNDWLLANPDHVLDCMNAEGLFNDFTPADQCLSEADLRPLRHRADQMIQSMGRELLEPAGMDQLAGLAGGATHRLPQTTSEPSGLMNSQPVPTQLSGLYCRPEELAARITDKNTHKTRILEQNPFLERLDYVMRAYQWECQRIVWVLMPLNGDIDIAQFGLDREIPSVLESKILRLAEQYGYRAVSGGAIWPGELFAPDDVVHLNEAGSARMATLIADSGCTEQENRSKSLPVVVEDLAVEYRSRVSDAEFAQAVQCAGTRVRIVALGENRPFLSAPLVADGSLHLSVSAPGPGVPLQLCLSTGVGDTVLAIPLDCAGEIHLRVAGHTVLIDTPNFHRRAEVADPILRIGYFDGDLADREAFITIDEVRAERPMWDLAILQSGEWLPLPFDFAMNDDVADVEINATTREQSVNIALP